MNAFWTVYKTQLNVNLGISALRYRFKKEKDKIPQTILVGIAIAVAVGILVGLYSMLMGAVYAAGHAVGRPEIVIVAAMLGLQLFLLITGIFYVIGVFFYSKDLSALVPLPLKPWQVLGAKFGVVMTYEYLMALPVLLPPILIYGAGQAMGPVYWLKAVLILIVSPAIPMLIASLVAILLMRFLNIGKRKDLLAIVGGTLVTVAIIVFNLLTQRFAQNIDSQGTLTKLLSDQMQAIHMFSSAFPPSAWATFSLTLPGMASALYLLLYTAVSAALAAAMLWLSNRLYYSTALRGEEANKRKKRSGKTAVLSSHTAGPVKALFLREFRLLLRTPAYAMNCLLGSILVPIIIPLSLVQGDAATSGLLELIRDPENAMTVTFVAAGVMLFSSLINVTASTAVSREGKTFWVSRMIPVTPQRQIFAKFLAAMAVSSSGLLLTAIMLVTVLRLDIGLCLTALVLGFLGSIPITIVNMLPDVYKPKLTWTNPYEAVKQNLSVLTAMLASVILTGIIVLAVLVLVFLNLPHWAVYLILAAILAVMTAAGMKVLDLAAERYYKIEV